MDTVWNQNQTGLNETDQYETPEIEQEELDETPQEEHKLKKFLPILGWTLTVCAVVFLVFLLSSKVGQFESISDMIRFIQMHF